MAVVQLVCERDSANRFVQGEFLCSVMNLRRLSLQTCFYTEQNIPLRHFPEIAYIELPCHPDE